MTTTCPHCHATVLSTSLPEHMGAAEIAINAVSDVVCRRDDMGYDHFNELATAIRAALAATPAVGGTHRCTWPDCDQPSGHDFCYRHCSDNVGHPAHPAAPPASPLRGDIRAALFSPETAHARHNLEGALYDIERFRDQGKPTDEVCIRTIKRVIEQLAKAERALSSPPEQPASPLRAAAERVCWFDWSDNDMDAVAAIDALRKAVTSASPPEQPAAECNCLMCLAEGENSPHRLRLKDQDSSALMPRTET